MNKYIGLFFLGLFFSGCIVGPNYKKPQVKVPQKFAFSQQSNTIADLAEWWNFFKDSYLNDLIQKAVNQNYSLRIAMEKIKETRALYQIEEAKLLPEIDAIGVASRSQFSKNLMQDSFIKKQSLPYFLAGFDVAWELDLWGKQQRAKNAAYNQYEAQIEDVRDIYVTLLGDVAKTYIDCRAVQKKIDLLIKQIDIDTQILFLTKDRFNSGLTSQMPDLEQLSILDESKSQLIILKTVLQQTVNRLAILLGLNPEEFNLIEGAHEVPLSKKMLETGLPSDLLRRRPDIRRAERQLASATESVGLAIADWFPKFSLLGGFNYEANQIHQIFSNKSFSFSVGPSVRAPVLTFGRIKYNVQAKKSIQKQALLSYEQSIIGALSDVENWLVAYFNEQDRVKILQEKLSTIEKERDLVKYLFDCGLNNMINLLTAEKNCIQIEIELTNSKQILSSNLVSVYKALGGGW